MNEEHLTWMSFFNAVAIEAKGLGYNIWQVDMFTYNIKELYEEGKSVEEVVEVIF